MSKVTTQEEFEKLLKQVGLKSTDTCLIHTSMQSLGMIPGGAQSIISGLQNVLCDGNIIMPEQNAMISDPYKWEYPPVSDEAAAIITANMPAYDKKLTPSWKMGQVPEYFRTLPNVIRNNQPLDSFSAWGKDAKYICSDSPSYDLPLGTTSPLQKIYNSNGKVVFIGTEYETCTAIHLAESSINRPLRYESAPVKDANGNTAWIKFQNVDYETYDDFNELGEYFEKKYQDKIAKVKLVKGYLKAFPIRLLVDEAKKYYALKDLNILNK